MHRASCATVLGLLLLMATGPPGIAQHPAPEWLAAGGRCDLRPTYVRPVYSWGTAYIWLPDPAEGGTTGVPPLTLPKQRMPEVVSERPRLSSFTVGGGSGTGAPPGAFVTAWREGDEEAPAEREPQAGEIRCLLDESGGTGTGYDRLYVDTDADGDLSDEEPLPLQPPDEPGPFEWASEYYAVSAPVELTVRYPADAGADPPVQKRTYFLQWDVQGGRYVTAYTPPLAGLLKTTGGTAAVGLVDGMADAAFGDEAFANDQLWLDLDEDRQISDDELLPWGCAACLGGTYIEAQAPIDGRWLVLRTVEPAGDAIQLDARDGRGNEVSVARLSVRSREWQPLLEAVAPPGELRLPDSDKVGRVDYDLTTTSPDGGPVAYSFSRSIEEEGGINPDSALKLGGVVEPTVSVEPEGPEGSSYVLVRFDLYTESKDQLTGITAGEDRLVAPGRVKLLAPDGSVADEAEIHFG